MSATLQGPPGVGGWVTGVRVPGEVGWVRYLLHAAQQAPYYHTRGIPHPISPLPQDQGSHPHFKDKETDSARRYSLGQHVCPGSPEAKPQRGGPMASGKGGSSLAQILLILNEELCGPSFR